MKKINVTFICAETEEYPGCNDLLFSYSEMNVVGLPATLSGAAVGKCLAQTDVLVIDESVLLRDGLHAVRAVHRRYSGLTILLVYKKQIKNKVMEYLSIGVRGLLERESRVSQLRRAIPALYAGEVWMPRGLVQSLRNQSIINGGSSSWEVFPTMMSERGKIN